MLQAPNAPHQEDTKYMDRDRQTLRSVGLAAGLAAALLVASTAGAQNTQINPAEAAVQPDVLMRTLEGMGYTNVHDLEWDDGFWEVEAVSPQGRPVDLLVHPQTGEIVHEEVD